MRVPAARIAVLAALSLLLSGCDLLYSYLDPLGVPPGDLGPPAASSEYTSGSATLKITQNGVTETVELHLARDSWYDTFGAWVTWESAEWSVTVSAYDTGVPGVTVAAGDVTITQGIGSTYWTAGSYIPIDAGNKCAVHVWELSATTLEGAVNCTALRWVDGMDYDQAYVDGEEPFEVGIDFHAEATEEPPGENG